jgi:hypothetical protein
LESQANPTRNPILAPMGFRQDDTEFAVLAYDPFCIPDAAAPFQFRLPTPDKAPWFPNPLT